MDNQFLRTDAGGGAGRGNAEANSPTPPLNVPLQTPAPPPADPSAGSGPPGAAITPPDSYISSQPTTTLSPSRLSRFSPRSRIIGGSILLLALIVGTVSAVIVFRSRQNTVANQSAADFASQSIPLANLAENGAIVLDGKTLNINGQLRANGSLIMTPAAEPAIPATGQLYYDQTSNHLKYYNGDQFVQVQTDQDAAGGGTVNNITNLSVSTNATGSASGTTGKIAKFTSGQALGDSILTDNNTYLAVNGGINLTAASSTSNFSFWSDEPTPAGFDTTEIANVELGVKFQVDVPGTIKSIRFYKATIENNVTIPVSLWTTAGTLVGQTSVTVSGSGWKTATFASPLAVSPDTTYVASYHINSVGSQPVGYPYTSQYFSSSGIDSGPLHALASGLDGGNGVYRYSASPVVPNQSFNSTNYWIDVTFSGSQFTTDSRIRINDSQISSSDLSNDNNLAKRGSSQVFSGHNIFRNAGDSVDVFSIQKADTTQLFTVDAANGRIYIGPVGGTTSNLNTILLVLSNKTSTGDPTNATDGAMYYNSTDGVYRCYASGSWSNCDASDPSRSFSLYDEFMGGQVTSFGTNSVIGSLGWNAQTIGADGSIDFNPSTPTPVADRPGVLHLTTPAAAGQGNTLMLANSSGASMIVAPGNTIRTSVAVGATTGQVLRVGVHNETTTTTQPVSGVWWEANPAVSSLWRYCYGDGSTATCANTTTPIAANTWVRLSITVYATGTGTSRADFTINSQVNGVNNVTIDSTNRVSPAYTCYGTSGSAENCYWDYYQLTGHTSAAR